MRTNKVLSFLLLLLLPVLVGAGNQVHDTECGLLGQLIDANMNSTSDQAIPISSASYIIRRIVVAGSTINLNTAAGGIYTSTSKGGTAIVASTQVYTALTGSSKYMELTLTSTVGTDIMTAGTLYFSLTTGDGEAGTADIYVHGERLD